MSKSRKSKSVPKKMQAKYDEIVAITDRVCAEHLNGEFAQLARYVTAALCRKRPSQTIPAGSVGKRNRCAAGSTVG